MKFEKTATPESDKHAESEAPKKVKKKSRRSAKEQADPQKILKAPVPRGILAEAENKEKEQTPSKTKRKKKAAKTPGTVSAAKKISKPKEPLPTENPNLRRKEKAAEDLVVTSNDEIVGAEKPQKSNETEQDPVSERTEETFTEEVILLNEIDNQEGEFFTSKRWQKESESDAVEEVIVGESSEAEPISVEDEDEDAVLSAISGPTQPLTSSSTASNTRSNPRTAAHQGAVAGSGGAATASGAGTPPPRQQSTATGGGGAIPPHVPPVAYANQQPIGGTPASANLAPPAPATANTSPYSNRTAERRNLIAGIIVGGVIEHIRHKRREKRMKTAHEKEVKGLKTEQQFQQAEKRKEKQKAERTKTTLEARLEYLKEQQSKATQKKPEDLLKEAGLVPPPPQAPTQKEKVPNIKSEAPSSFYEEFKQKYRSPDSVAAAAETKAQPKQPAEKPVSAPRQNPENIDEPIQVSPDKRVETSAWHRIEVDKKTGQAVENPELAYGEEFQKEQHQEQLRQQIAEASMETEHVKQSYMPIIDKTSSTSFEIHDTPHPPARPSKQPSPTSVSETIQGIRDKAADSNAVDLALVGVLFIIIIAIIAVLV